MIARRSWIRFYLVTPQEIQLIREYELIMLNYSEDKQERLEQVLSWNGLSPSLGELRVRRFLASWVFRTYLLQLENCQVVWEDGSSWRKSYLAYLADEPTHHLDIATISGWPSFWKNSRECVLFITHDRFLDALSTRIFRWIAQAWPVPGEITRTCSPKRQNGLLHKKNNSAELAWMRRQPQRDANQAAGSYQSFPPPEKEVSGGACRLTTNFGNQWIGKKVIEVSGYFLCLWKQAYFARF